MKIYYKIWVDAIVRLKSLPDRGMWKFFSMLYISMAMAINLCTIMAILGRHIVIFRIYDLEIDIFPGTKLDAFISFFILFLLPPLIINYLLIFRSKRYKILVEKYPSQNGRLFALYFLSSILLPFVLLLVAYIFRQSSWRIYCVFRPWLVFFTNQFTCSSFCPSLVLFQQP